MANLKQWVCVTLTRDGPGCNDAVCRGRGTLER